MRENRSFFAAAASKETLNQDGDNKKSCELCLGGGNTFFLPDLSLNQINSFPQLLDIYNVIVGSLLDKVRMATDSSTWKTLYPLQ